MSESGEDRDRQLVPRWRSFVSAADFGELQPLNPRSADAFSESMLFDGLKDWQKERSLSVAADVVSSAVTIGLPKTARDAAQFVLEHEHAPETAKEIAQRCLHGSDAPPSECFIESYRQPALATLDASIHRTRQRLIEYPFNPVLWTNLALLYTTTGQPRKSERAMTVALDLAPNNRFVVRAACRLFLHQSDSERAHQVLLRATSTKSDPWLMASEIAIASVRRRTSSLIKTARRIVESQNFAPFHVSELSGALATLEAYSGNAKKASRLFAQSLTEPAENAIAQAAWAGRNIDTTTLQPLLPISEKSNEASAWIARGAGDWEEAFCHAKEWQAEQPFSSRPALFASYAASTGLEDFEAAEEVLEQGIRCNPDDGSLLNNYAFVLAKQGRVAKARQYLDQAAGLTITNESRICLTATEGLLEFRSGNTEQGRALYNQAIANANTPKLEPLGQIAKVYLAIEELHAGTSLALESLNQATKAAESLRSPYQETFLDKLQRAKSTRRL